MANYCTPSHFYFSSKQKTAEICILIKNPKLGKYLTQHAGQVLRDRKNKEIYKLLLKEPC